ncbi:MAG: polysaccharide biosynthesis C-terminal domain-containing protein [Bacteroidota bacterium]|nr:polysaccharide biosynthesis C-terminal domain-containing protein [Bacteroidota bacterium]
MIDKITRLGKDTLIYGTSTVLGRLLNFLLVPIYTNFLSPSDYGITAYIYSLLAFLNVIYNYGMESAYFRYSASQEIGNPKQNFSTPFISIATTSFIFSGIIISLATPIAEAVNIPLHYSSIILYSGLILFFDALAIVPFALLRQKNKAKLFATIKFLNIVINVSLNILLLVKYKMGIEGIFISGTIASLITFIFLLPTVLKNLTFNFSGDLYKVLLKFGLPSLPAGFALMVIQVIDRPILRALTDNASVGIYQANYKLGIFMMLVVSMFDYAWKPFFFARAKDDNAKELFARITTYFFLLMSIVLLIITFFIEDIVKIQISGRFIIHPDYWVGLNIIPIIMLGYLFYGLSLTFSAGIYLEKKTIYLPIITFTAAAVNVVINFLLIPAIGIMGAAVATLASYITMSVLMFFYSQKFYKINYEFIRILKITIAGALTFILFFSIPKTEYHLILKLLVLFVFVILLYLFTFFRKGEINKLKQLLSSLSNKKP